MQLSALLDALVDPEVDDVAARDEIPCRAYDPELWFAELPVQVERAKALCVECPARAACLEGALERAEPWGVWEASSSCRVSSSRASGRAAGPASRRWPRDPHPSPHPLSARGPSPAPGRPARPARPARLINQKLCSSRRFIMYALQEQLAREHQRALRARAQEARVARRAADYAKAEREVHRARVASERAQRQLRALSA